MFFPKQSWFLTYSNTANRSMIFIYLFIYDKICNQSKSIKSLADNVVRIPEMPTRRNHWNDSNSKWRPKVILRHLILSRKSNISRFFSPLPHSSISENSDNNVKCYVEEFIFSGSIILVRYLRIGNTKIIIFRKLSTSGTLQWHADQSIFYSSECLPAVLMSNHSLWYWWVNQSLGLL